MRRIFYTNLISTAFAFFGELRLMIRRCDEGGVALRIFLGVCKCVSYGSVCVQKSFCVLDG